MDDFNLLHNILPAIEQQGLFPYSRQFAWSDTSWGMYRLTYPAMILLLFKIGALWGTTAFYLTNGLFSLIVLVLACIVLARIIQVRAAWVMLVCFLMPQTYDLFQHPSLQEKLLHLFGASLLFAAHRWNGRLSWPFAMVLMSSVLGMLTKTSFCIYLAMACFVFLQAYIQTNRRYSFPLLLILFTLWSVLFVFLLWVARQGNYTQQYSLDRIKPQLLSVNGLFFIVPCLLAGFYYLRAAKFRLHVDRLVPWIGVCSFLIIFLPWGIRGYIASIISPAIAALLIALFTDLVPLHCQRYGILILSLATVSMGIYRPYDMFQHLHDIRSIVESAPKFSAQGMKNIIMPCEEGAASLENFFQYFANTPIKVSYSRDLEQIMRSKDPVLLYDLSMCPLPGKILRVQNCEEELLFEPRWQRSYRMVRLKNCRVS